MTHKKPLVEKLGLNFVLKILGLHVLKVKAGFVL